MIQRNKMFNLLNSSESQLNLIRHHETLRRGADRIFRPKTPSMAASVTNQSWTFSKLLVYPYQVNDMVTLPIFYTRNWLKPQGPIIKQPESFFKRYPVSRQPLIWVL